MTDSYRVPDSRCPNCGGAMDAAGPVTGGRAPETGDIAICFYCHHLSVYGDGLRLRNPNDEEMIDMAGDPEVVLAMKMLGAPLPHPRAGRS